MTKILGTANRQIAVDDTVYDIDLIPPNTPIDTDDIDKEIHKAILRVGSFTTDEQQDIDIAELKALIANQVREARLDELERLELRLCKSTQYGIPVVDLQSAIDDRIAELQANPLLEKEQQP